MRRDLRRHTDGDTAGTVHQQIRETAGQNGGFLQTVVVVGNKIDGVLVDIGEHFHGNFAHLRLGITVSSRRVAVDGTEVTVTVYQHVAHREILRQTHHCVINRGVAVRVISTQHGTDGVGALMIWL